MTWDVRVGDEPLQEFSGDAVDRHEDDQRPAKPLRPAAEIGQNAEDGEKAQMNSELAPGEDGERKTQQARRDVAQGAGR